MADVDGKNETDKTRESQNANASDDQSDVRSRRRDVEEALKAATHSTDDAGPKEPPHAHMTEQTGRHADTSWKDKGR